MAASPKYKVFTPEGLYVASCKFLEDAAAIVAAYGEGAEIRYTHKPSGVIFRESPTLGDESAANSYDSAAATARKNETLSLGKRCLAPSNPA